MNVASAAHVVIVGAGHAGGSAAAALRQFGHAGPITLIGDEPSAPYQRPPLSKAWLKGEADGESLLLKPAHWYADNAIDLRLATTVERIDPLRGLVALASGGEVGFDALIFATGARARRLTIPGTDAYGVLALRHMADAEALKTSLGRGRRLAVVGGGYVGLEAAASARALGADVVVIEREARVLARVACVELSDFFTELHRSHGVAFALAAQVERFETHEGRVAAVALADGRSFACDAVLVGVGAVPNDEAARAAGIVCADGVVVDLAARTSAPNVFAIGDVARRPMPHYDRLHRLESVPNALEQARQAAAAITGRPPPAPETPWFWSDQYDVKLQIAGVAFDADRRVVRGDPATHRFAVFHLMGDRLRAVEAINSPPEFMAGRQLIGRAAAVDAQRLADPACSMREVAR